MDCKIVFLHYMMWYLMSVKMNKQQKISLVGLSDEVRLATELNGGLRQIE